MQEVAEGPYQRVRISSRVLSIQLIAVFTLHKPTLPHQLPAPHHSILFSYLILSCCQLQISHDLA